MVLLTREHIIQNSTFNKIEVDVTEWGNIDPATGERERTTVFVREMSARERDEYEESLVTGKGRKRAINYKDMRAKLIVCTCCDEGGNLLFTQDDIPFLSEKPTQILNRIIDAIKQVNGMTDEEDEEEAVKN